MDTIQRLSVIRGIIYLVVGLAVILLAMVFAGMPILAVCQTGGILAMIFGGGLFLLGGIGAILDSRPRKKRLTDNQRLETVIAVLISYFGHEGQTGYAEGLQKLVGEYKGEEWD